MARPSPRAVTRLSICRTVAAVMIAALAAGWSAPWPAADDLSAAGYAVLQTHCVRCHGEEFSFPGLDMRRRNTLLASDAPDAAKPRPPSLQSGRAFFDLRPSEEHVVRLRNRSAHETAGTLTIDGLSMFAFSEVGNFGGQVLIPAGRFVEIPGWFITKNKADLFEIGRYVESAAVAKRLLKTSVGVVTATFHESIEGSGKDPLATKRGRQIDQTYVEEKRVVKPPIAVVSVRYDR